MFKKDRIRLKDIHDLRDLMLRQGEDYEKELNEMLEKNKNPNTEEYLKSLILHNTLAQHELRQTFLKIEMLPQS